jgi:molecular chaperone GrpE
VQARVLAAEARAAELEDEHAKLRDQALRAMAEAENTRRRLARELDEGLKFAIANFAREIVAVGDNLRRALDTLTAEARAADPKLEQFAQGVELTEREFLTVLERHGIQRVAAIGQPFDPAVHQAIAQLETAEHPPGTVMQVVQAGFTLQGRILRPALVVVAKAPAGDAPPPGATVDTTA